MSAGPSLLIIVLHYRGLDDTLECLDSLDKQDYGNFHTLVIDNGSNDNLKSVLRPKYQRVEVVEAEENRGWSAGNNLGVRLGIERNHDIVCLLNNDTVVPEGVIARLIETMLALGTCCLHPAVDSYGADNTVQLDPIIPEPPEMKIKAVVGLNGVFEINLLYGCCVFISTDIFRQIGLIDERYFLLSEDADLGRRALAAGYRLYCDSSVRIQHKESRSFGGRRQPVKTYYSIRNLLLFSERHDGGLSNLRGIGRYFGWTVWRTAEAAGSPPRSWWDLARWLCSGDMFAVAVRMGIRDYLLRRFGRLALRDERRLMPGTRADIGNPRIQ